MVSAQGTKPIAEWREGDRIQGFALLTRKERRQDRNGKDYLDMEVADCTGSMVAKAWSDSMALHGSYEAHQFVAVRGVVKSYRDQLQFTVDDCRVANDRDRELGFDESLLVPSTHEDIDDLYQRLSKLLEGLVDPFLLRLAQETLAVHGGALREHPAAKGIHHAYRGGLLEHTVSMAELAVAICDHYRYLRREHMLVGILFHDLGKIQELGAMPANDYTLAGRMVGHIVMGHAMLRERCAAIENFPQDVQLHLEHLVLSHQGHLEFASPVRPMTAEALALHALDDLDSKLNQLLRAAGKGESMPFLRGLSRYVYLGEDPSAFGQPVDPQAGVPLDDTTPDGLAGPAGHDEGGGDSPEGGTPGEQPGLPGLGGR